MVDYVSLHSRDLIQCLRCNSYLADHHALATDCFIQYAEDGAQGRPQCHSLLRETFANKTEFEDWRDDMYKRFQIILRRK
ncbi:hypothetical protein RB195_011339 [Necator americanus]